MNPVEIVEVMGIGHKCVEYGSVWQLFVLLTLCNPYMCYTEFLSPCCTCFYSCFCMLNQWGIQIIRSITINQQIDENQNQHEYKI